MNECKKTLKKNIKYETYKNALRVLNIKQDYKRRQKVLRAFGKMHLYIDQTKYLFPNNENQHMTKKIKRMHTDTEKLITLQGHRGRIFNETGNIWKDKPIV